MPQAVPGTIRFYMVMRYWHFGSCITQLAFRKLAVDTSPNVSSAVALHKLPAADGRVIQNVLHDFAIVTCKNIAVDSRVHHVAPGTFGMNALQLSVAQFFWNEVVLWPLQLSVVRRTACVWLVSVWVYSLGKAIRPNNNEKLILLGKNTGGA